MVANLSIVLVEDNDQLRQLTIDALSTEGHRVIGLSCAEELEDFVRGEHADVFLIDLNLPGEDGFSLARRIRQSHPLVCIIIISARSDLESKLMSYECGADWYLSKPVTFKELSAALKSFMRRKYAHQLEAVPQAGAWQLHQMVIEGPAGKVTLTVSERTLLTAFARAPAGRLEVWQIAELLNIEITTANRSRLEVRIFRLRKKLMSAGAQGSVIEAVRSFGYQLNLLIQITT
jgi:DNA-binding response OmpR family regulator